MEIHLLRHGLAVHRGTAGFEEDALRPPMPKGRLAEVFDLIWSVPLARAKPAAEIIAKERGWKKRAKLFNALAPDGEATLAGLFTPSN